MASYKLVFKRSVAKDLRKISNKDVKKILSTIDSQLDDPRSEACIKLSGQQRYRIRQGVYRIVYEIEDKQLIILVVKITHHKRNL